MKLKDFLKDRINQLEDRIFMIPKYVQNPNRFIGKKDFSMDDIPKLQADLEETKVALWAIQNYKNLDKLKLMPKEPNPERSVATKML